MTATNLRPGALVAYRDRHGVSRGPSGTVAEILQDGNARVNWEGARQDRDEDVTPEDVGTAATSSTVPGARLEDIGDPSFPADLGPAQGFRSAGWPPPLSTFHVQHGPEAPVPDQEPCRDGHPDDLRADETRNAPSEGWA